MLEWSHDLISSLPEDLTMDKDNLLMFGLTACALGLSIYIIWGPKLGKRSQCSLIALQNLGLTCFLNSLLQALASCPSFFEWLDERRNNGCISSSLHDVLKILCYERELENDYDVYSPDELNHQLRSKAWRTFPQEQDPHELFLYMLTVIEEEEQKSTPERAESLLDALETEEEQLTARVTSHGDVPMVKRIITTKIEKPVLTPSPFRGYLASQLSCLSCGSKSAVMYDKFDTLTLALPSKGIISYRLQRLLNDFVSAELIDGFSCDHCNKGRDPADPPVLSQASKAIKIGKLPKCLCFHISRTYMNNNGLMYKRDNYVDFPEYLMMSQYTHNSSMLNDRKKKCQSSETNVLTTDKAPIVVGASTESDSSDKYESLGSPNASEGTGLSSPDEFQSPVTLQEPNVVKNNNNITVSSRLLAATTNFISGPVYRLKAVIEHRGTIDSGHFVTYRRGPLLSQLRHRSSELVELSESRWYFTSDDVVKESSLCDALQANAYMLFYEKCLNDPDTNGLVA